jgi:lysophospholipid acyltransferase (LPLAT)-like uncharacterized protein
MKLRSVKKKAPLDPVSCAILLAGTILGKTWSYHVTGTKIIDPFRDKDKGVIFCFWHCYILILSYVFRNIGVKAVVSSSKDGDRVTAVAQRWNHDTIRGSSSLHGMAVLRQCVRELRRRQNIVLIPDGPRGPREIVKPGIAQIAFLANAPVFPVIAIPEKFWRLNSWDRFMIPKPFSKIELRIDEPVLPSLFANTDNPISNFTECLQRKLTL